MGLAQPFTTADGRRIMIDSDVLDIADRIRAGDAAVGWAGDERMYLEWSQIMDRFVVMREAEDGAVVQVMTWPAPLDQRLLIALRNGDTRRPGNDPVGELIARDEKREADDDAAFAEYAREEVGPRLAHALRKDGMEVAGALWAPGWDKEAAACQTSTATP